MSGNRVRSWGYPCNVCGMRYMVTNYQRRYAIDDRGELRYTDMHEAKCNGWELLNRRIDPRHPHNSGHRLYLLERDDPSRSGGH